MKKFFETNMRRAGNTAFVVGTPADKLNKIMKMMKDLFGEKAFFKCYKLPMEIEGECITWLSHNYLDPALSVYILIDMGIVVGRGYDFQEEGVDKFVISNIDIPIFTALIEWQRTNEKITHKNIRTALEQLNLSRPEIYHPERRVIVVRGSRRTDYIDGALWQRYWASRGKPGGPGAWDVRENVADDIERFKQAVDIEEAFRQAIFQPPSFNGGN